MKFSAVRVLYITMALVCTAAVASSQNTNQGSQQGRGTAQPPASRGSTPPRGQAPARGGARGTAPATPVPDGVTVTRRDSGGIAVIENALSGTPPKSRFTIDTTPLVTVRPNARDTLAGRGRLADARVLASGVIVTADDLDDRLRFHSRYGDLLQIAGGRGLEQGGFTRLTTLAVRGDTLVACCAPGVALFNAQGKFIRATPPFHGNLAGVFQNGRYLIRRTADEASAYQGQKGVFKTLLLDTLFSADRAGTFSGRLAALPSRVHVSVFNPDPNPLGTSITYLESPFEPESQYAVWQNGFYFTDGRNLDVRYYTSAGRMQRIVRLQVPAVPLTGPVVDQYRQIILRKYTNETTRRYIEWVLGQYVNPKEIPLVRGMRVASDGHIWLREHGFPAPDHASWHVFAPDGTYQGALRLPANWNIHQIENDFVVVSSTDPTTKWESVSLHRLTKGQ